MNTLNVKFLYMQEGLTRGVKAIAFVLIAVAAIMASYQYKISVSTTYPTRTFSVEGTGDVDVTPDLATFSVTVTTDGSKNVSEVQKINTEKMNKVTAYLKEQGIDKKDLKTAQYNLAPQYSYVPCVAGSCPAPSITGYSLTQTLDVKVRESEKLGDLLSGVVANGANSVSEVRFVVDDDTDSKNEAREKAISDAKKKATATAKAAGFRLGKLVTMYESTTPPMYGYGMGGDMEMSAKAMNAAPAIEPGTKTTKVQVTLTYEIKN